VGGTAGGRWRLGDYFGIRGHDQEEGRQNTGRMAERSLRDRREATQPCDEKAAQTEHATQITTCAPPAEAVLGQPRVAGSTSPWCAGFAAIDGIGTRSSRSV